MAGCCEQVNEPSCSIKGEELLDSLSDCQLLKKDCPMDYVTSSGCTWFMPRLGPRDSRRLQP
jgi:hypothetical protein